MSEKKEYIEREHAIKSVRETYPMQETIGEGGSRMSERRFCPKCQRLLDYDPYYKAWFCTSCSYRKYDKED